MWSPPTPALHASLPSAGYNLELFTVVNHNRGVTAFGEIFSPSELSNLRVVLGIPELATAVRSEGGLVDCSPTLLCSV